VAIQRTLGLLPQWRAGVGPVGCVDFGSNGSSVSQALRPGLISEVSLFMLADIQ